MFIDKFQDTNSVQTEIIKMLAKKETVIGFIGEDFYTLSYTNNIVNRMKLNLEEDYDAVKAEKLLAEDGYYNRKLLIINIVKAIEVARDNNYQDAIIIIFMEIIGLMNLAVKLEVMEVLMNYIVK